MATNSMLSLAGKVSFPAYCFHVASLLFIVLFALAVCLWTAGLAPRWFWLTPACVIQVCNDTFVLIYAAVEVKRSVCLIWWRSVKSSNHPHFVLQTFNSKQQTLQARSHFVLQLGGSCVHVPHSALPRDGRILWSGDAFRQDIGQSWGEGAYI